MKPTREPRPDQPLLPILSYDIYAVAFSGGKDSVACLLYLLEQGVPKERIELHHHLVDGKEDNLMDWPITEAYCQAFATAIGVRIYFSWRQGGFRRSMTRTNAIVAPVNWQSRYNPALIQAAHGARHRRATCIRK